MTWADRSPEITIARGEPHRCLACGQHVHASVAINREAWLCVRDAERIGVVATKMRSGDERLEP